MIRPTVLTCALWLACASLAQAEAPADAASTYTQEFKRIQVTATRNAREVADVPNTVSVIDAEQMEDHLVRDIQDLVRYEPGVSVTSSFGRFGAGGFRIRGLDGNRVRILVDGIAVADAFSIGSFSNAGRNMVGLDTIKQVEIVRGPSSSLYGSDALGGVVSFITKDPYDYLKDGKNSYFGFKMGYEGDWKGIFGSATAAFGGERWSGLVAVGHRQGKETENMGRVGGEGQSRTQPNPQDRDGRSLLTRLVYAPNAQQRLRLTVEGNEDRTDTNLLNTLGYQPMTRATTTAATGRDRQTRARVSLAHEWNGLNAGFADSLDWQIYRQDSETTQNTHEERTLPAPTLRDIRDRVFNFDQRTYGVQANFRKGFETGAAQHTLTYGLDLSQTRTRQKRDGVRTLPLTGGVSNVVSPDVFPVRDFPNSRATVAALYVQDEIALVDGRLRLVPGLRVDHYRLSPKMDNIFAEDNPGINPTRLNETSVSPKFGLVWHFNDAWSLFGGYARGFRSPPYNDVNIGFTNRQFGYTAIPNPDLKPETSDGLELGTRFSGQAAYASVSGYFNRYDDFIESLVNLGTNAQGLMVFQSQNIAKAQIYGAELKAGVDFGGLSPRWEGWSLRGAAAWARGKDRNSGARLNSVDPLTATLGLAYDQSQWGVELASRFAGGKRGVERAKQYGGYGVFDLYAHWNFAPGAKFNVGVFNLGDRRYSNVGDLPDVGASQNSLERYTAPGRTLSASVAVSW